MRFRGRGGDKALDGPALGVLLKPQKRKGLYGFFLFPRPATLTMLVKAISHRAVFSI